MLIRTILRDIAVLVPFAITNVANGQASSIPGDPPAFREPMTLYAVGLGPYARTIMTNSAEAQAFFNQGVQLLYSFTPIDAARSFREAQKRDPLCAMCHFGEAWAWGPYLNGAMSAANAPRAYAALQRATALKSGASPVERALIEAMAVRYEESHRPERRAHLDTLYSREIERVYAAYPNDPDVGTLYAESLMLLLPRRGTWDITTAPVQRIHSTLEGILTRNLDHPGACHLFVHATESTTRADKAERCADLLGRSIPGASHINHMPSHTYNRVGRWGDAVKANIEAWHSDIRAGWGEGFAIYPSHNLHMLLFSASYDGQGAIAIQAAKDYAKISNGGVFYQSLTLLRFGRFDEILELNTAPTQRLFRAMWEFGRGYAHLRSKAADSASVYLGRVEEAAKTLPESQVFRGHTPAQLLGVLGGILRGEVLRAEGKTAEAIAAFESAVRIEDELRYDEPEPLNFSARHWLGAALLEANRGADAERVYRAELADHPTNGWSLFGLAAALAAQGKNADATAARAEFSKAWVRSDAVIRSSRF